MLGFVLLMFEWLSDACNSDNKCLRILFAPVRFVGRCVWWVCAAFTNFVSGEFILKSSIPNGGTIIFVRSAWVAAILYGVALLLHSGSYAEWDMGILDMAAPHRLWAAEA